MNETKDYMLKRLNQLIRTQLRKALRSKRNNRVLVLITECLYNIVKGVVPVRIKKKMKWYEKISKIILRKSTTAERRRSVFLSKLGFKLVQQVIFFCYNYLTN